MASLAAARSIFRSSSARNAAARLSSQPNSIPKASRPSPLRVSANKSFSEFISRRPVELSFGVESLLPYHSATASALMTSKLSISRKSSGWLLDGS